MGGGPPAGRRPDPARLAAEERSGRGSARLGAARRGSTRSRPCGSPPPREEGARGAGGAGAGPREGFSRTSRVGVAEERGRWAAEAGGPAQRSRGRGQGVVAASRMRVGAARAAGGDGEAEERVGVAWWVGVARRGRVFGAGLALVEAGRRRRGRPEPGVCGGEAPRGEPQRLDGASPSSPGARPGAPHPAASPSRRLRAGPLEAPPLPGALTSCTRPLRPRATPRPPAASEEPPAGRGPLAPWASGGGAARTRLPGHELS